MLKLNFNKRSFIFILLLATFALLADSSAAYSNKRHKSTKKTKISEKQIQTRKAERIAELYKYFPQFAQWEQAEIYPYNDFAFLEKFDQTSIFEDYYKRKLLLDRVNDWLGTPYRLPGRSRKGVDCSNFVSIIISETLNKDIPAGAATQATLFKKINNMDSLQFGDLIFFSGRNKKAKRIGHVGIYIGNGLFAHSSTSSGVIYTHLSDGYYTQRYRCGGRIIRNDILPIAKL